MTEGQKKAEMVILYSVIWKDGFPKIAHRDFVREYAPTAVAASDGWATSPHDAIWRARQKAERAIARARQEIDRNVFDLELLAKLKEGETYEPGTQQAV